MTLSFASHSLSPELFKLKRTVPDGHAPACVTYFVTNAKQCDHVHEAGEEGLDATW